MEQDLLEVGLVRYAAVVMMLVCVAGGCGSPQAQQEGPVADEDAARCAENWRARGYDFDPKEMTCTQMYDRVRTIGRAEFWAVQGYRFDPNTRTAYEMDEMARQLRAVGLRRYTDPTLQQQGAPARQPSPPAATSTPPPAEAEVRAPSPAAGGPPETTAAPAPTEAATVPEAPAVVAAEPNEVTAQEPKPDQPPPRERVRQWLATATISDVRTGYPQYNDLGDIELARRIHATYFAETDFDEFTARFLRKQP
jgi:hypothetical protein